MDPKGVLYSAPINGASVDFFNKNSVTFEVFSDTIGNNCKNPKTHRVALIVAGMHRSGTSALTRVLHEFGYELPLTLLDPDDINNPMGHWESMPIVQLNEEILSFFGTTWSGFENLPDEWHLNDEYVHFTKRAIDLLEKEFSHTENFVIKDPRICRLLPFWINALKIWGARPEIVYMTRAPSEVARSLSARDGLIPALGELIWLRYVLDAERAGRNTSRTYVSYSNLIKNSDSEIARLYSILSPKEHRRVGEVSQTSSQLIRADLRHHHGCVNVTRGLPGSWVESVAEIFEHWEFHGENRDDQEILDKIRLEFDSMIASYGYLFGETIRALTSANQVIKRIALRGHNVEEVSMQVAAAFIRDNYLFDGDWYLQRYSDVAAAGVDPAVHFVRYGDAEFRDPGPLFSTSRYLAAHHDVAESGINALVHFIVHGAKEGRMIFPANSI